jgi:hypothetical protein
MAVFFFFFWFLIEEEKKEACRDIKKERIWRDGGESGPLEREAGTDFIS